MMPNETEILHLFLLELLVRIHHGNCFDLKLELEEEVHDISRFSFVRYVMMVDRTRRYKLEDVALLVMFG